ncbi:uncharacterized protein LOC131249165 [Magnolia sinica]|uniref:uncharacterized protein LOC131249165 n=1 Tax=Magnolia sinica TaxID=86752 RepID=UPI00265A4BD3|nr:uncharacterized protein LOC131249165 [Magnolia sinica]
MEDSISTFCKTLSSFCNHIQSTSDALKESVHRRPIPLDSASSTFIQCLNRRVSSAGPDLNLLESMVLGTVSFEELLGHCNEAYRKNQTDLAELEDRFQSFGYVPEVEVDDEDGVSVLATPVGIDSKFLSPQEPVSPAGSLRKRLEDDPLFDDSVCLQDLGLSDVCLATLASEADDELASPKMLSQNPTSYDNDQPSEKKVSNGPLMKDSGTIGEKNIYPLNSAGQLGDVPNSIGSVAKTIIKITKDDYDELPSYMKSLASWEDLQAIVVKMNSVLCKREKPIGGNSFNPDEIASLELGPKGRSYLLMLLRMNRLVVETVEGSISYRVTDDTCK